MNDIFGIPVEVLDSLPDGQVIATAIAYVLMRKDDDE